MDREQYRQASLTLWNAIAGGWGRERQMLWGGSRAVGEDLVARLNPRAGDTVLELAAGTGDTGFVAAAAIGEQGRLISTDFSPAMLEEARANGARLGLENVEYRVLDAESMDLEDDSVDGVLCKYGYMLMGDPAAALAETRRVLRPDGRLSFSVWGPPELNPWAAVPGATMVDLGHIPASQPGDPGIFAMADPERIRELVAGAGFGNPEISSVPMRWPIFDLDAFHRFIDDLAGPIKLTLDSLSEEDRATTWEEIERRIAPHLEGGEGIAGLCHNVVAENG